MDSSHLGLVITSFKVIKGPRQNIGISWKDGQTDGQNAYSYR